ncbi:MAG: TetR/AcrR family transcriptional regulator [Acidobacteriota bacterium]|jgi:TetR/AcrR family transcriptional regulator|nr:TetR/AcrR family transcriptional regulator [Acidobacteriota bacterium]
MSAADRQRQLLEVALNAFSRRGFKGTTTKEIAAAAGVAEAVIFQHFPSKEALYSAVLELHLDSENEREWTDSVSRCMERNDDAGVFRLFIGRILESYRRDSMIHRVILFAALEGHEQGLARMHAQFAPVFERFMDYIARRQREGALVNCNPHAIMIGLGGIAHQYGLITQIFRAPSLGTTHEEMAELFTQILLHGVQATPSAEGTDSTNQKPAEPGIRKAKE